jgi:hypothetical protein
MYSVCRGNFGRRGALPATYAAGLASSFATDPGSTASRCSWRPSMIQPGWTNIIGNQEFGVDAEYFQWTSAALRERRARRQGGSAPGAHEFAWSEIGAIVRALRRVLNANATKRKQEEECDSHAEPEQTPPSFHRESASRARCKLRSLFNSASSRKHSCSFCQAATPSRVAGSAPLGT